MNPVEIIITDSHPIVQEGLRYLLKDEPDILIVGAADTGEHGIELARQMNPDVMLLDLALPDISGFDVIRTVKQSGLKTQIVDFTVYEVAAYAAEAMKAGALGYVLKSGAGYELSEAIRAVIRGRQYVSPGIVVDSGAVPEKPIKTRGIDSLTPREIEILQWTVDGLTAIDIARRQGISERTVQTHRANIMRKLGVHSRRELLLVAVQGGLFTKQPSS
jgi:DNA-binding NarL/FixJ family response regulator